MDIDILWYFPAGGEECGILTQEAETEEDTWLGEGKSH